MNEYLKDALNCATINFLTQTKELLQLTHENQLQRKIEASVSY
jgi:hypothetical protein